MRYFPVISLLGLVLMTSPACASKWTAAELATMPPYCAGRYARVTNHAEYKRWEAQYGADFIHTHHLCDGIGLLNKYPRVANSVEKREMMKSIMDNLNYMIQNAKSDFKLMPDVYYYRGQAHQLSGKPIEAIGDLRKAIELNPLYVPAYTLLADYLQRQGQQKEALQVVAEGVRQKPDSSSLQRLYVKLGGDPQALTVASLPPSQADNVLNLQEQVAGERLPPKRAVFDVGKIISGGVNVLAEAGSYVFFEFRESAPAERNKVLMTVSSHIPQPAARVVRIGIDMGAHRDMITSIKVADPTQSQYYLITQGAASEPHAFWPRFTPIYSIKFTRARSEKGYDLYDPRALPPGKSLPVELTLAPGYTIDELVEAVKKGIRDSSGIRMAVIINHTKGYRPDPRRTIMDDGGFVTGSIRQLDGFEKNQSIQTDVIPSAKAKSAAQISNEPAESDNASRQSRSVDLKNQPVPDSGPTNPATQSGSAKNPWCRFCPTE